MPPSGIYEEQYVRIGGIDQWATIHGTNRDNPVLLFVHGGPGDTTNPWTFIMFRAWLNHFTLVQWDQRSAGKTFQKTGPGVAPTITAQRIVDDGLELTEYLCAHLRKPKIVIVAHSMGTLFALQMAKRSEHRYHAYVGTGQVADSRTSYAVAYASLLEHARDRQSSGGRRTYARRSAALHVRRRLRGAAEVVERLRRR